MSTLRSLNSEKGTRRKAPNRLQKARLSWNDIPCSEQNKIKAYCKTRAMQGDGFKEIVKNIAQKTWGLTKKYGPTAWEKVIKPYILPIIKAEIEKKMKGSGLRIAGERRGGALTLVGNGKCCKKKRGKGLHP